MRIARCPACHGDLDRKATVCPVCGYNFVAEREKRAAVMAMIPLADGKPAVHVDGRDGSVFVCRRLSRLRLAPEECVFSGWCDWVEPPEARPGELTDGMAISHPDCLRLGPVVPRRVLQLVHGLRAVIRSPVTGGDHSWVPAFLKSVSSPKKKPKGKQPQRTA